jgi:hypothetical protein
MPEKFAGVDLAKQRANAHQIPVLKTAIKFERLQCVIRNMFFPFGCGVIDSRMKILIHVEKIRSCGGIRMYGTPNAHQQP